MFPTDFLNRLLGRPTKKELRKAALKSFEELLKKHVARTKSHFPTMASHWNKLLLPDILAFSTSAIDEGLRKSIPGGHHHYLGRRFSGIYVAVSAIPTANLSLAKSFFSEGYTRFVDVLLNEAGYTAGDCDLAHWILCFGEEQQIVHLTFLPAFDLLKSQDSNTRAVWAQDLMTEAEKQQKGIA